MKTPTAESENKNPFEDFYQNPYYLEFKNHSYNYRVRRRSIRRELKVSKPSGFILEIGSGVSSMTKGGPEVIYSDISSLSVRYLKEKFKTSHAIEMSITEIAMKTDSISTIICSEVLEHVPNDREALKELLRVLKPGGELILTVPAHPYFYAFDDFFVKHERRYAVKEFVSELNHMGFTEVKITKVTGLLDKLALLAVTRFYAFFLAGKQNKPTIPGKKSTLMLKGLLLGYKIISLLYLGLVIIEAALCPLACSSVIMVTCSKKSGSGAYPSL